MEAQLRVLIDDGIEKLILPSGIPDTVEDLKAVIKESFGIPDECNILYLDSDFEDFFTLHRCDQIKNKDTVKIVKATPVLDLFPFEEPLPSSISDPSVDLESTDIIGLSASALNHPAESSASSMSSEASTVILPPRSPTERCQPWPKPFPIPKFAYETEICLERAAEEYQRTGARLKPSKVKKDILDELSKSVFEYTAYPSGAQISEVAEALCTKYPFLKEPGSFSGFYGWQQSLRYKMFNYRTKLRSFGVPEVMCNSLRHKSPANQKLTKNVKKPKKAEVNYLPPYPAGETEESLEQERIQLLTEVKKRDNNKVIKEMMCNTFAHRRNEIVNQMPSIKDFHARWPALFEASQIEEEFHRITTVHLEAKFMAKLDEYTPRLMTIFQAKGGSMGLRLQAILLKAPTNPDVNLMRDLIIQCLMVYYGDSLNDLLKEYDDADQDRMSEDLAAQKMKIYSIMSSSAEGPGDVGVVIEGVKVLTTLGTFARACCMLLGLTYALNLAYPKELRYTFEIFQKLLLELDCSKQSPRLHTLRNKLLD